MNLRSSCLFFFALACSVAAFPQARSGSPAAPPAAAKTAQQKGAASAAGLPGAPSATTPESNVPETTTVITVDGVCEVSPNGTVTTPAQAAAGKKPSSTAGSSQADSNCKTQITRAEFEKLMKTVAPGAPVTARRQIASRYVQLLAAANEGVKLGVENDPEYAELLGVLRLQTLAQNAERKLQTQAANVSEADEKDYYDQNPSAFEEVTLTRIFVPRSAAGQSSPEANEIAESARQQLARGADADKVQKSVFEQEKNTNEPPSTKFGAKRRGALPPAQEQKIFALKQGEVSDVIPDSTGYVIYRVDSKRQIPFADAKEDAKRRIIQQRLEDARQQIMGASKADYNDAYFGPEPDRSKMGPPGNAAPAPGAPANPPSQPSNPK